MADLRVMGRVDPARDGSVSSLDLRILMTWIRKEMLRVITTITGTARNKVDDLHSSLGYSFSMVLNSRNGKKLSKSFSQIDKVWW